jgi:hypothetical protein
VRGGLSKLSKDNSVGQQLNQLKIPQDSSKLEKQIKSLVSKLENGASLVPSVYNINSSNLIILAFKVVDSLMINIII